MSKLTNEYGLIACQSCVNPKCKHCVTLHKAVERLQKIEAAEMPNLVVGDSVWVIKGKYDYDKGIYHSYKPEEAKVVMITQKADKTWRIRFTTVTYHNHHDLPITDIGRHFYLTEEDAQRKADEENAKVVQENETKG